VNHKFVGRLTETLADVEGVDASSVTLIGSAEQLDSYHRVMTSVVANPAKHGMLAAGRLEAGAFPALLVWAFLVDGQMCLYQLQVRDEPPRVRDLVAYSTSAAVEVNAVIRDVVEAMAAVAEHSASTLAVSR
jgi:hypothetical protein